MISAKMIQASANGFKTLNLAGFDHWIVSALPTMQMAPSAMDSTAIKMNQIHECERTLIRYPRKIWIGTAALEEFRKNDEW